MIDKVKHSAGKLVSFTLILFFVALGVLGILLPILPGLLFLFIAAVLASRHYPPLAFLLERNRYCRQCMRICNGFMDQDWWGKVRLCFWGTVKMTVDGVEWTLSLLRKALVNLRAGVRK